MPWIIIGAISWLIFFLFVDIKHLRKTIYSGLFASLMAGIVDWGGQRLNFYRFDDMVFPIANSPTFYIFGPVFVVGILFAQHLPRKKGLQILNIFVISALYLTLEYLLLQTPVAKHLNWNLLASYATNLGAFTTLTYVVQVFNLFPTHDNWYRI